LFLVDSGAHVKIYPNQSHPLLYTLTIPPYSIQVNEKE